MNRLQPNEQILTGAWLVQDGRARGDAACERIEWLIAHHLQKIADRPRSGAWETLYRDPEDGRYWERTYPQGEMHGGGPPQLKRLTIQEASDKYGAAVSTP
jgi:Immunity protein 27